MNTAAFATFAPLLLDCPFLRLWCIKVNGEMTTIIIGTYPMEIAQA